MNKCAGYGIALHSAALEIVCLDTGIERIGTDFRGINTSRNIELSITKRRQL